MINGLVPTDLENGDAEAFSISIDSITLQNGVTVKPPTVGVTVVVGGNNVGKSTLLRQTVEFSARHSSVIPNPARWQLVNDIRFNRSGTMRDCAAWLASHFGSTVTNGMLSFNPGGEAAAKEHDVRQFFAMSSTEVDKLYALWRFFMLRGEPLQRLGEINPQQMRENSDSPSIFPVHHLEDSPSMMSELRQICLEVFRVDLTLDTYARMIQLRLGERPIPVPLADAVPAEYRREVASLPSLSEQGDGMKSLIGLLLPIITAKRQIVLIDEPEAFLHPPQASALGRVLGELAQKKKIQVIIATHDKNLLAGLLSSEAEVSVVRLDRDLSGGSHAHQLAAEDVRILSQDPLLKHTNVLDALFHRLTVITEADRDCRFYAAALSEYEPRAEIPIPSSDVLFVPSYGKAAMYKISKVLHKIFVPVVSFPDMDILYDETDISRLVQSYGANWGDFKKDYKIATEPFRAAREPATVGDVLKAVQSVFSGREAEKYSGTVKKEVDAQLRTKENPWSRLKRFGDKAFEGGQAAAAGKRLLDNLEAIGIVLVRVGDLEKFAPTLEVAKGPAWLSAALAAGAHKERDAREHVKRCIPKLEPHSSGQ
ncbi:ATP-dependent endonuclease [Streptomyces sp. NPDC056529]|uniref:ATP-dependent nuclease n=1 Tax=Streptomyces sp. NPDC056529 TaxID=3345855 RepID=UPI003680B035